MLSKKRRFRDLKSICFKEVPNPQSIFLKMKNEVSEIHKMIYSLFYSHERLPQLKYFKKLFDIVSIVSIVPRVRTVKFNQ